MAASSTLVKQLALTADKVFVKRPDTVRTPDSGYLLHLVKRYSLGRNA